MRISDWSSDVCSSDLGISGWVQYARTVRGATMVERNKEYVQAARLIGMRPFMVLRRHILPNVLGPEIGRASCRASVCQYVLILVVAVTFKKNNISQTIPTKS